MKSEDFHFITIVNRSAAIILMVMLLQINIYRHTNAQKLLLVLYKVRQIG